MRYFASPPGVFWVSVCYYSVYLDFEDVVLERGIQGIRSD